MNGLELHNYHNTGALFAIENELHLFGDVNGLKLLGIGCGSGHSLKYHADNGAAELWGIRYV